MYFLFVTQNKFSTTFNRKHKRSYKVTESGGSKDPEERLRGMPEDMVDL